MAADQPDRIIGNLKKDETMKLADNKATLSFSNGSPSVELPVYQGSIGPEVIDIRKLYAQTGMFTYDPGFFPPHRASLPSPTSMATG